MEVKDIFSRLKTHMLEGMVFHDEMMRYFRFLGFDGYASFHHHQYNEETEGYHKLCKYYLDHYNFMIPYGDMERREVIPESWYRYNKKEVDASTKRTGVKNGIEKWVEWEEETKALYEEMCKELILMEEIASADFLKHYIKDVDEELSRADKKHITLETVGYDIGYIMADQH